MVEEPEVKRSINARLDGGDGEEKEEKKKPKRKENIGKQRAYTHTHIQIGTTNQKQYIELPFI